MVRMKSISGAAIEYHIAGRENNQRDHTQYHTDSNKGEPPGTWWTPTLKPDTSVKFRFVKSGTEVIPNHLRALASGHDPHTNAQLVPKLQKRRKMGWDCAYSLPKPLAAAYVAADTEKRKIIEACMIDAVNAVNQKMFDDCWFAVRRGKAGKRQEAAEDVAVANFLHHTSRADDPEPHIHSVWANIAQSADGKIRCLENKRAMDRQRIATNYFRAEVSKLIEERLPLKTIRLENNKGFHVLGVPETLVDLWSSRKKAIENRVEELTGSRETTGAIARMAALSTRKNKSQTTDWRTLDQPDGRWNRDLESLGWSREQIWKNLTLATKIQNQTENRSLIEGGMTREEMRQADLKRLADEALAELSNKQAVFRTIDLEFAIAEKLQCTGGMVEIDEQIARIKNEKLIHLGIYDNEMQYSTPEMMKMETELIRHALRRKMEPQRVTDERIEQAIAEQKSRNPQAALSTEQADVVRWCLGKNGGGICVASGKAGAGKSATMAILADIARQLADSPQNVWAIAPSHKAKSNLAQEIKIKSEEYSRALAGFNSRIERGEIKLDDKQLIILDEAGMVSTSEIYKLVKNLNGAKLILLGDTRQLQPISAGSPMRLLSKFVGSSEIKKVRRQKEEWARAASEDLAIGNVEKALREYDKRGYINWHDNRALAFAALVSAVKKDIVENPKNNRIVIATTNFDVREINAELRVAYKEAWLIDKQDYKVSGIARGTDDVVELQIFKGERLIFGEGISKYGVNNADFATIIDIKNSGQDGNPIVKLKIDGSDKVIEAKWLELQGYRNQIDERERRCKPRISLGLCSTVHSSQGATLDKSFVFAGGDDDEGVSSGGKFGCEAAYVALTRHRHECQLFVNTGRVRQIINDQASAKTNEIKLYADGSASFADDMDLKSSDPTMEQVKSAFFKICAKSDMKQNVFDFCQNPEEFVAGREEFKFRESMENDKESEKNRLEFWHTLNGGYEGLPENEKVIAEQAWKEWQSVDPDKHTYNLTDYVEYVQERAEKHKPQPIDDEDEDYDDTRTWTTRPGWHQHQAAPLPPLTPDQLREDMERRLASKISYPAPEISGAEIPAGIAALARRHETVKVPEPERLVPLPEPEPRAKTQVTELRPETPAKVQAIEIAERQRREREQQEQQQYYGRRM